MKVDQEKLHEFNMSVKYGQWLIWEDPADKQYIRVVLFACYEDDTCNIIFENYTDLLPYINPRWKICDGAAVTLRVKAPDKEGFRVVNWDIGAYKELNDFFKNQYLEEGEDE